MRIEQAGLTPEIAKQNAANEAMQPQPVSPAQRTGERQADDSTNRSEVIKAVDRFNEIAEPLQTNIEFRFHEKLNEYYVVVIDKSTDEVVKEIPSKKVLDMYAAMTEFMGIFQDRKL
ncbi:flagellar protein FlaG [Aciduricibacillus chroicocephali]|uniref:Flagellar protein FlaG n=1 Tax=Aciduricibacillus chroicocephali TaxID=3054939 RepID=A0ABY9KW67_9BACI|nr:flagellar protein FlaG [Bacillaceae bacterium 44XB]